jgi:hypothetical protein
MLRRVTLVRTDVPEELSASIIRATKICDLGTLAVTSNRRTLRRSTLYFVYIRNQNSVFIPAIHSSGWNNTCVCIHVCERMYARVQPLPCKRSSKFHRWEVQHELQYVRTRKWGCAVRGPYGPHGVWSADGRIATTGCELNRNGVAQPVSVAEETLRHCCLLGELLVG